MQRQNGFTLIEVMVALALMAAIASALTVLISQTLDARNQLVENRTHSAERIVDFLTRVDQQLSQIVPRYAHERGQRLNTQVLHLQNSNQELYWVATGQWALPVGDYYSRLRLWRLVWSRESQRLSLESSGLLDAALEQVWIEVDHLDGVSAISWSFWQQDKWQTSLTGGLPSGIRLTLTWQDKTWYRSMLLPNTLQPKQPQSPSNEPNNPSVYEVDNAL